MSRRAIRFTKNHSKTRGNPFRFPYTKQSSKLPLFSLIFIILILGGFFYWLFFSAHFAIEKIQVQSNFNLPISRINELVSEQIQNKRWGIIPQNNIFAFDGTELSQKISQEFLIEKIYIEKERPHTINITSTEMPREAVWGTRNRFYALDAQGIILGLILKTQIKDTPIIYDQSGGVLNLKEQVLDTGVLSFATRLFQDAYIKTLAPEFFIVEKPMSTDLTLKTKNWKIYFDAKATLESQLKNLDTTLAHSIPPEKRDNLDYIDLRFGEKVYFKYR